jgi:hypothetical protein
MLAKDHAGSFAAVVCANLFPGSPEPLVNCMRGKREFQRCRLCIMALRDKGEGLQFLRREVSGVHVQRILHARGVANAIYETELDLVTASIMGVTCSRLGKWIGVTLRPKDFDRSLYVNGNELLSQRISLQKGVLKNLKQFRGRMAVINFATVSF